MRLLLVMAVAVVFGVSAAEAAETSNDVKLVEYFVSTPINELPPDRVDDFMAVDESKLPAKLKPKYEGRRLELQTLKQLAEGKKKGTVRTPDKNCAVPDEAKSDKPGALKMAGFQEIEESDVQCVGERTGCSERDMLCEFSLQIVVLRDPKSKRVRERRYFMYPNDPLMAVIAACRAKAGGNTNFFGGPQPVCSHY